MLRRLFGLFIRRPDPPVDQEIGPVGRRNADPKPKVQRNPLTGKLRVPLKGNGSFSFDIVGEASYQAALEKIAGRKTSEAKNFACRATISHEPTNTFDPNAVKVEIAGHIVGYFAKADAKDYTGQTLASGQGNRSEEVAALIVGGFKTKAKEGHYGVKLDITRHA